MASCSGPSAPGSCGPQAFTAWVGACGLKCGQHQPAREQVGRRRSGKAAHIRAGERKAAQSEVEKLRRSLAKVIPGRRVVASPGNSIALAAGKAGARHHKGPLVGAQRKYTIMRGARVLHTVDVVNFRVPGRARSKARLIDAMLHVIRHGLGWIDKYGRLV